MFNSEFNSNLDKEIQCTGVGGRATSFSYTIPYSNTIIAICVYDNNAGTPTCTCDNNNVILIGSHKNSGTNCFIFKATNLVNTSVTFTFDSIADAPMYVCVAYEGTATQIDTTLTASGTLNSTFGIIFGMRDVGASAYPVITYDSSCTLISAACKYQSTAGHYNRAMWIEIIKLHTDSIGVNLVVSEKAGCIGLS